MKIPIGLNLPDQEIVDPKGQKLENVVVTELGVRKRPGSTDFVDLSTAASVDGIYDWQEQDLVVIISDGEVWKVSNSAYLEPSYLLLETGDALLLEDSTRLLLQSDSSATDVSGATGLTANKRVIFANYGDYLYMANGGKIQELHPAASYVSHGGNDYQCILNHTAVAGAGGNEPGVATATATYWTDLGAGSTYDAWVADTRYGSGNADELEDPSAPTTVSFICVADGYLLALEDGSQRLWWSYPFIPYQWDSDFTSAEFLPDNATCMIQYNNDIFIGGSRSVEIFQNDRTTPWVSSIYGAISTGVYAPYSMVNCPEIGLMWVDSNKRLVTFSGERKVQSINKSIDDFIRQQVTTNDIIADYAIVEGIPFYLMHFPSAGQSIGVNLLNNTWSEWLTGELRWEGNCITNVPAWSMTLIGDNNDGMVRRLGSEYEDDTGTTISATIRTPRLPSGGVTRTPTLLVYFMKLSEEPNAGSSSFSVRWRDDGKDWVTARTITLDDRQDTDFMRYLKRLGHYRYYRQYEFDCSNMWPFGIAFVEQLDG